MSEIAAVRFRAKDGREILFRSFEPGDYPRVEVLQMHVARESTHTLKYPEMPLASEEKVVALWNEYKGHPVNIHLGAFCEDRVVGNLRLFQRNPNHPWIKHIAAFGMAVTQDHWGQGIGLKLLEIAEAHARQAGIKRIEAEVRCSNTGGISLYKKAGFKIEGTRERAAYINGEFQDEYSIAKLIDGT